MVKKEIKDLATVGLLTKLAALDAQKSELIARAKQLGLDVSPNGREPLAPIVPRKRRTSAKSKSIYMRTAEGRRQVSERMKRYWRERKRAQRSAEKAES